MVLIPDAITTADAASGWAWPHAKSATRCAPNVARASDLNPCTFTPITKGQLIPIYQCYHPQGLLTKAAKAEIVEGVTSIHCNATGAPRSFVNVLFLELPDGDCFVAGKPATHSYIVGNIRHGRDLETRQGMLRDLSQLWIRVTGHSEAELLVWLNEVDPKNAMEAGLTLPEPCHEQEWFDENRARLAELGVAG